MRPICWAETACPSPRLPCRCKAARGQSREEKSKAIRSDAKDFVNEMTGRIGRAVGADTCLAAIRSQ